jgi:hypothetical protein
MPENCCGKCALSFSPDADSEQTKKRNLGCQRQFAWNDANPHPMAENFFDFSTMHTNLGHSNWSHAIWVLLPNFLQVIALLVALHFSRSNLARRSGFGLVVTVGGFLGFIISCFLLPAWPFSLAVLAIIWSCGWLRRCIVQKVLWQSIVSGLLLTVASFVCLLMWFFWHPWFIPPSRVEVTAMVSQIGPERLLADAVTMDEQFEKSGGSNTKSALVMMPERIWPASFKALKPLSVSRDGTTQRSFSVLLLSERSRLILLLIFPAGNPSQNRAGIKIADGIYWSESE